MDYLVFVYKGNSRELKKNMGIILKSGVANNIKRFNYVKSYSLEEKNIKKEEEKILLIYTENQDKLVDFLSKGFPQMERININ